MKAYNIDKNGYLINEVDCQMSPREPGKYLIPRNAITEPLPFNPQENETFKWEGKWVLKPDYSGIPYYNINDKSVKFFEIGEEFDYNYTKEQPISPTSEFINGVWVENDSLKRIKELELKRIDLLKEIISLDRKCIRPMRSYILYNNEEDKEFLIELENDILVIRTEIQSIDAEIKQLEELNV